MSDEQLNHDPNEGREDVNMGAEESAPMGSSPENSSDAAGETSAENAGTGANSGGEADDLSHLEEQLADVDADQDVNDPQALREELAKQGDELARARADYYNLTQTHNNFVRRSKSDVAAARGMGHGEVVEALMPVLDDIAAARDAGALEDGPFAAIANKLENTLKSRFGFERFGEAGEEFDPNIHEAVMATPSADVEVETVHQVVQMGYRSGDKVLRAAKVIVANPQ
ncbi:MAG: nucleotide exchange factor GrpE [Actinomycetaceae bacterium]|nr:nucleotide exchange factor GrpE [Actinomycetaceae bacterium]